MSKKINSSDTINDTTLHEILLNMDARLKHIEDITADYRAVIIKLVRQSNEVVKFLKQIDFAEVPSNYTTFYKNNLNDDINQGKIKYNSKILHQSKLVSYFNGDYEISKIEEDLEKFLMKIKADRDYILTKKDIIFLEALKSDGVNISNKYDDLYQNKHSDMPLDIQKMIRLYGANLSSKGVDTYQLTPSKKGISTRKNWRCINDL